MEETRNTRAIVLDSRPYREADTLLTIYSLDFGRLNLVARGAKKISSKLAGHLQPMSEVRLMIIKGKSLDYVGGVVMENAFLSTREDLNKLFYCGKILALFLSLVKEGEKDERLFSLIKKYLEKIDEEDDGEFSKEKGELFFIRFVLSFLQVAGYAPEVGRCIYCQKELVKGVNYFSLKDGGVFCSACYINRREDENQHYLTISNDCVIIIRHLMTSENKLTLKVKKKTMQETLSLVSKFIVYLK